MAILYQVQRTLVIQSELFLELEVLHTEVLEKTLIFYIQ